MDIILASSRGRGLSEEIWARHPYPERVKIMPKGGAKLHDLQFTAYDILYDHPDPTNCHIYFFAGLCDITHKDTEKNYEEVFYIENPEQTFDRISKTIDTISQHILFFAAKPIFCPIITMSLHNWNTHRLSKHKTSFLMHHTQYPEMQHHLNQAIEQINKYINTVNTSNDIVTPFLTDTIMTKSAHSHPRIHYSRFTDGVHASQDLKERWAKCLCRSIKFNRDFPAQRRRLDL